MAKRAAAVYHDGGVPSALRHSVRKAEAFVVYPFAKLTLSPRTFQFHGETYNYFAHPYNATWRCERAVEIPLARRFLSEVAGQIGVEVGNVLVHYGAIGHIVVDKYERSPNVLNIDVLDFRPPQAFDFVISISTLEHVGWDEEPRDPAKVERAIRWLQGLLTPTGRMLLTCPIGYNPFLDRLVASGALLPREEGFLRRAKPTSGPWTEVSGTDVWREHDRCTSERAQSLWVAEFGACPPSDHAFTQGDESAGT